MKQESRFIHHTHVIFRKEEDGAYLYDPDSENIQYLNRIGASLYELCDGLHPVEEMITRIADEYRDVPIDRIEKDVRSFLAELSKANYVKMT